MKKFYITTSIAYTNAPPHIGFALELVQADVLARYRRLQGEDVYFLTGTDEHGAKIAKAAEKEGKDPQQFADELSERFRKLTEVLDISNTDFIRTSDERRHLPALKKVWSELKEKGKLYKKKYKGLYCTGCEAFVTEKELVEGKCPIHLKEPEATEEENYFFKLSDYAGEIRDAIKKERLKIIPESRKREILNFAEGGLEDVSFSRSKEKYWGFPVPGDPGQTVYCWADALTNYISAIGYAGDEKKFKKYWPADVHCIGKDIQRFHALIWPAMILALNLDLPKILFVHGFISSEGKKMSKSLGNVVDPFELVEKYGTDPVRYYLLREIPSAEDGDFSYDKFERRYNGDLASGIGNLLARVKSMALKHGFKKGEAAEEIKKAEKEYHKALEDFNFARALESIWKLVRFSDKLIEKEKPWEGNSPEVLGGLLEILDKIGELLEPFLPETSLKIKKELERGREGFKKEKTEPLFPKIENSVE